MNHVGDLTSSSAQFSTHVSSSTGGGVVSGNGDHQSVGNPYEWYNSQYNNSSTSYNNHNHNNSNVVIPTSGNVTNNSILANFYTAHNLTPIMNYT